MKALLDDELFEDAADLDGALDEALGLIELEPPPPIELTLVVVEEWMGRPSLS